MYYSLQIGSTPVSTWSDNDVLHIMLKSPRSGGDAIVESSGVNAAGCGGNYGYVVSQTELNLRESMRLLWEQHVYWTRMVIISIAAGLPDLDPTTQRLLRSATDFEAAFTPFYGAEIGHKFGELINAHLVIAAELVKAAKAGDSQGASDAETRWYQNADQIVCFLNQINPYWDIELMRALWYEHLSLTKSEAVLRLGGNFAEDIATFDRIELQALMMADIFAEGFIRQFCL